MTRRDSAAALAAAAALWMGCDTAAAAETLGAATTSALERARDAGMEGRRNPLEGRPDAVADGRALYLVYCAVCHGGDGRGRGPAAPGLDPPPVNFADEARWQATSIGAKQWMILNGVEGTQMAPSGLSEKDSWRILAYLASLERS